MSEPKLLQKLYEVAEEIGTLLERAQKDLDPDQFRVLERGADRTIPSLQRLGIQLAHLEEQFLRFQGRPLRRRQNAIIYDFKPTKKRPSRGPGSKR